MVPSRVKTMSRESSRAGSVIDGGSSPWDCRRSAPATTPSTLPSSRCSGMVNMTRASAVGPAMSSETSGLPSTRVRRSASRSAGSRSAAFSSRPPRRFRRSSPLLRATCMASKNCTAGRPCCSTHSSDEGESSMPGVMPAATVRSTFWLCSILLASRRATTSTSSVCCATTRRMASCPDARVTSQAETPPEKATASTATSTMRSTSGPGTNQPGSCGGSACGAGGVMGSPQGKCRARRWRGTWARGYRLGSCQRIYAAPAPRGLGGTLGQAQGQTLEPKRPQSALITPRSRPFQQPAMDCRARG